MFNWRLPAEFIFEKTKRRSPRLRFLAPHLRSPTLTVTPCKSREETLRPTTREKSSTLLSKRTIPARSYKARFALFLKKKSTGSVGRGSAARLYFWINRLTSGADFNSIHFLEAKSQRLGFDLSFLCTLGARNFWIEFLIKHILSNRFDSILVFFFLRQNK